MAQVVYRIPDVDEDVEDIVVGRFYFSMETARSAHKCPCGNLIKKGDRRLHVNGHNNTNSGNACIECANRLMELIKNG